MNEDKPVDETSAEYKKKIRREKYLAEKKEFIEEMVTSDMKPKPSKE